VREGAREEVVDGDDALPPPDKGPAQVRAQETGAAGDDHAPVRHARPIPSYAKPRRRRAAGSSRLRASMILRSAMASPTLSKSSHRSSSHSVRITSTDAPSQAA